MTDEDPFYYIGIHAEHRDGCASGMGYSTMDESSASSFFQEMADASSVVSVEMVLRRYIDDELTDEVLIKGWEEND